MDVNRWPRMLGPIVFACAVLVPADALAQTSLQIPLQFDFLNPGAKSLALGGAFVGLADDATATFANPAGLTQLGASELSIEGRGSRIATQFLQIGRLSGPLSNQGTDTIQGAVFGDSVGSQGGVAFLAGVYSHPSRRWVIAGYRHELARVDQAFSSNGVFQKEPSQLGSQRDLPQDGHRQVDITGYGISGSYKVGHRFNTVGFFCPANLDSVAGTATQNGDGTRWAPTLGLMAGRDARRFGVVYRRGATFDITTRDGNTPEQAGVFRVPDTLAFGASFRSGSSLLAAVEVTHVWYSRLREDFVTDQARASNRQYSFTIDDVTEIHGGVQYAVPRWRGIPRFRGGLWFDPDHSVQFTPDPSRPADALFDERLTVALSKGRNQVHGTGGLGLTLGRHLEFNAAFDIAPTVRIFSSSLILR
jgi:long-chain fatty acid transport protein